MAAPPMDRGMSSTVGRASGPAATGILPSLARIKPTAKVRTVRRQVTPKLVDGEWSLSDFSGGPPFMINEDLSDGEDGIWQASATVILAASSFPEQNATLEVDIGGFGQSTIGFFYTASGGSFQVKANTSAVVDAESLTVGCSFVNSSSLATASGLTMTLIFRAYRIGS